MKIMLPKKRAPPHQMMFLLIAATKSVWTQNTDQGSQFTDSDFTDVLKKAGVQISMDGRGRCHDNIFIERLWRSVKYEYIYLNAIEGGSNLRKGLHQYFEWYNQERPHQGLGYRKPDEIYYEDLINQAVA